jgi:hypothetical protein
MKIVITTIVMAMGMVIIDKMKDFLSCNDADDRPLS